ncbi:hypothetical protein [Pedobacter sp.]|uniref:hypothetical protein n=1 Tax=Pedobacter sp. TaxID=1411316 RepID=UPI003BA87C3A
MKRRLILGERIMHVDAKTPLNCVFTAKIAGYIDDIKLNAALIKIQQKHPLLRMKIDHSGKEPYFVLNEQMAKIPVRVVTRTGDYDWQKESKKEWYKLFDQENLPLARLVWLKGDTFSDFLLVLPHCICDGTTILNLMRELMSLIDDPEQKLDVYESFSSVRDLLPADFSQSRLSHFKGKMFSAISRLFFLFKSTRYKNIEQNNYVLSWKVSETQTLALLRKCKAEKTSIHAAICVAFIEAFKTVKAEKAHGKVISPIDIRRFVPAIKTDTMFAFAPIAELKIDQSLEHFWPKARKLKVDLEEKIADMKIYDLLNMSEYFHSSVNKMVGFLKSTPGTHDVTLSNMGRLDITADYREFKIETIYSPTVAFPWRNANTLVVSSFNNQLDFSFLSNASFLSEFEAWQIKTEAMILLTNHLNEIVHA